VEVKKAGRFALGLPKGFAFVQTPLLGYNRGKSSPTAAHIIDQYQ
jgi:hypothetical protein